MDIKNQHSRVLLSKNEGGAITFCEGCNLLELDIGSLSLRLDGLALELLNQLMSEAKTSMRLYKQEKARFKHITLHKFGMH